MRCTSHRKTLNSNEQDWLRASDLKKECLARGQALHDYSCAYKLLVLKDWSGRMDLNHRPPGPEPGALARLRYAPTA